MTFAFGGGPKRSRQADTLPSQHDELTKFFCQRTKRKLVQEVGDGHCGIRGLWRQFDRAIGEGSASMNSEHIRNGRKKLASALRTYPSSIIEVSSKTMAEWVASHLPRSFKHMHCHGRNGVFLRSLFCEYYTTPMCVFGI